MKRWLGALAVLVALVALVSVGGAAEQGAPFWGARQSLPPGTLPGNIKPGQFLWVADEEPSGPVAVIVSLTEQRAFVYRNGVLIGIASVSTGRPGHPTPTGVFTVLQKDVDHHSSLYHDAPMPYTERLTWGGISLHAGGLPGYPSSHGCVHLPSEFARRLFAIAPMGMIVVIADKHSAPVDVDQPPMLSPINPTTGADDEEAGLPKGEMERWEPQNSPAGPLSIVIGRADRRAVVLRNGIEIGRARITVADPEKPLGTHAFVAVEGKGATPRWIAIGVPGHESTSPATLDPFGTSRVSLPAAFLADVGPLIAPGTTLVVTDGSILPETTGVKLNVVDAEPPATGHGESPPAP